MSALKELAVAAIAPLINQLGEGVREELRARCERDKPCEHGKPGGRLCAACAEKRG